MAVDALAILQQLDPSNADHWTSDGLPRVDVVSALAGGVQVTREQITNAAPKLTRESAAAALEAASAGEADGAEKTAPSADPAAPWEGDPEADASEASGDSSFIEEGQELLDPYAEVSDEELAEIDVVNMPTKQVMSSPRLVARALEQIDEIYQAKVLQRDKLDVELKELAAKANITSIALTRMRQGMTKEQDTSIKDYLKQSRLAREEKAARAAAFIKSGTTAQDVAAQLQTKSPLDKAMNARKPARGSQRPKVLPRG